MGVSENGDAKYYLDPSFDIDPNIDKLSLKKKYKEEIREQIQLYIDKKTSAKPPPNKPHIPEKK